MSSVFTEAEIINAGRPHVGKGVFLELETTNGIVRLHNGMSEVEVGGKTWHGVSNPFGPRLVGITGLEQPYPGQAAAVTITLSGVDLEFFQYMIKIGRQLEGLKCDLYWCLFDEYTGEPLSALRGVFVRGKLSSPFCNRKANTVRTVTITVENIWDAMDFDGGRIWNDADQQRFYPGDKGFEYAGVQFSEVLK